MAASSDTRSRDSLYVSSSVYEARFRQKLFCREVRRENQRIFGDIMTIPDTNQIIRQYLVTPATPLFTLVGTRIYCPRLPENVKLRTIAGVSTPAISFFTRGGTSTPYIPDYISPSVQFDCWADNLIDARLVYRALYDLLQGIQQIPVVIGATTYHIKSAIEEVQGQDLQDQEIQNYFRVLAFFQIIISE